MNKAAYALRQFQCHNCSQAVLAAFISREDSFLLKIASSFGAGMARGDTCGAVTGAYMTIGLRKGYETQTAESGKLLRREVRFFNKAFIAENGSLLCKELLGVNISTPRGRKQAIERQLFATRCPLLIRSACTILENKFLF